MVTHDSSRAILTASDIKKLEDDFARMNGELAELDRKRADIERRRGEAASRLGKIRELLTALGLEDRLSLSSTPHNRETVPAPLFDEHDGSDGGSASHRSPWIPTILGALRAGQYESLTSTELRSAIEAGPLANLLSVSDKGYYHSIRRLALRGDITKKHGRIFTKVGLKAYEEAVKNGSAAPPGPAVAGFAKKSPMAEAILEYLSKRDGGIRTSEIVTHLMLDPRFSGPVGRNKSSAYNVLARLESRGQLVRHGTGMWSMPRNKEAPENSEASEESLGMG